MATIGNEGIVLLIAEDDDGYFQLMKKKLKRSGMPNKIVRFIDGEEVLLFLEKQTDTEYLLILDIRMPKLDGIEVLKRIQQAGNFINIPIVMHSSTADPSTMELCYSLGCIDYIVKSGNSQDILQILDYIS